MFFSVDFWTSKFENFLLGYERKNCFCIMNYLYYLLRAVERIVDVTRGSGKILKYDSKRSKFCSLRPALL